MMLKVTGGDTTVNAYYKMSDADSILSYTFKPEKQTIVDINHILNDSIYENDSIRYFNDQIGIRIDAIRLNEAEKAAAIEQDVLEQNISFDGAVGASKQETKLKQSRITKKRREPRICISVHRVLLVLRLTQQELLQPVN